MKRLASIIAIVLGCAGSACAAISGLTIWECRGDGSSTNGGGFVAGSSGTDWSQQASPQYSVTDGVANGTTTLTSATASFGTDVVGNLIYVSGGTGSITAARYQIISRTNSTTIVVDRSTGLTSGTGVTLKIGGAVDTPVTINSAVVAGNVVYVKKYATPYNLSSNLSLTSGTVSSGVAKPTVWVGYDTNRTAVNTDTPPTFSSNNNALSPCITLNSYVIAHNLFVDGSGSTKAARGYTVAGSTDLCILSRCKVSVFTDCGILITGGVAVGCYVTGGTSAASNGAININATQASCIGSVADNNATTGIIGAGVGLIEHNLVINNTTSNGHGISITTGARTPVVRNNSCYNNAGDGIRISGSFTQPGFCVNNLLVSNAGYGINSATGDNQSTSGTPAGTQFTDYNAFYSNTSGARNNLGAGSHDITLSGSPFANAGSGDFSLNSTSGAGAACRGVGWIPSFYGVSTSSFSDIGAAQHQDSGGGGAGGVSRSRAVNGG